MDSGGNTVGDFLHGSGTAMGSDKLLSGWEFRKSCLIHHIPTLIVGAFINYIGQKNRILVPLLCMGTVLLAYVFMFVMHVSLEEARAAGWFWRDEDFQSDNAQFDKGWSPPLPFGVLNGVLNGKVYFPAMIKGLPVVFGYAIIYLIRCSLHAPALKKNAVILRKILEEQEQERVKQNNDGESNIKRPRFGSDLSDVGIVNSQSTSVSSQVTLPDLLRLYSKVFCIL